MGRGSRRLRLFLVAAVATLMGLNAVGAYGFLAKAHIAAAVAGETAVAVRIADIDGRIAEQNATLADIDRKLSQIDGAINKALEKGRTNAAMALANDQRHNRSELEVNRQAAGKVLVDLKVEKARIEGDRKTVEADPGAGEISRDPARHWQRIGVARVHPGRGDVVGSARSAVTAGSNARLSRPGGPV